MFKKYFISLILVFFCNVALSSTTNSIGKTCYNDCDTCDLDQGKEIIDDIFVDEISEKILKWEKIQGVYKSAKVVYSKKINDNFHRILDSVATISDEKDILQYYVGDEKNFLLCASVSSHKIDIPEFLFIGQPLVYFQKKFGFYKDINVLIIKTTEHTDFVKLFFKKGKLAKVVYKLSYIE